MDLVSAFSSGLVQRW